MTARLPAWRIVLLFLLGLSAATALARQQPIFQSGVRLVQASVIVHDKNGQPVTDLAAGDFKLFEDGKEQPIELFVVEKAAGRDNLEGGGKPLGNPAGGGTPLGLPTASSPGVFTNQFDARVGGGVTVILFDRLNSSFEDQTRARDQIINYLARIQPTDHVALYLLESDVVQVLHDFTSDASRLIRVLSKYLGTSSSELAGSETTVPEFARVGIASVDAETEAWLAKTTEMISAAYLRRRAQLTTAALESIANHLAGVRGRKNLVWVSGAFPLMFTEDGRPQVMNREVDRATRAINNANIAVYPVDVRGLIGAFSNPAAVSATYSGKTPPPVFTTMATTHPSQDSMRTIADATGGRVFVNTNAIGEAVRRAIDDSRVSYVLGYYPARTNWDGKFREISVKVNRAGLDVRHRKGYLALAPPARTGAKARAEGLVEVIRNPLEATGIGLSAAIDGDTNLVVRVEASALTWERRDVMREGAMDILVAQSVPDGTIYKIKETTVNLNADPDRFAQMMNEGFTLTVKVALRSDAYRLHVVVGDVATLATGSLIIPADQIRAAIQPK
jgi:VWFA-related protein